MKITNLQLMKPISIILICGCMLAACHRPLKRKDQINRIEIADGGCMTGCPVFGIRIDSTLALKYYGGYKAKLRGYYSGRVTQGFWDTLNTKLEQIKFKGLETNNFGELDGHSAEIVVYWNKQKRHFMRSIYEDPDSISHILIWIADSYKHIQLKKSNDTLKFETTYQFMMPPSPKSKLDQVKFPPPKKIRK
jgi:hypothetical protein